MKKNFSKTHDINIKLALLTINQYFGDFEIK